MWAVLAWVCECGAHVKVMYDTDGRTMILCPIPPCRIKHPVDGKVSKLWVESADHTWTSYDVTAYLAS